jgi:exosome complex exonuclease DIS3/RRP44
MYTHFKKILINLMVIFQNEVKRRSGPNYKRMKGLIGSGKKCFVFVNEFCQETFSQRVRGETSNDYNDRLIRRAVKYYNNKGRCFILNFRTSKI